MWHSQIFVLYSGQFPVYSMFSCFFSVMREEKSEKSLIMTWHILLHAIISIESFAFLLIWTTHCNIAGLNQARFPCGKTKPPLKIVNKQTPHLNQNKTHNFRISNENWWKQKRKSIKTRHFVNNANCRLCLNEWWHKMKRMASLQMVCLCDCEWIGKLLSISKWIYSQYEKGDSDT